MTLELDTLAERARAHGWSVGNGTVTQVQKMAKSLGWTEVPIRRGGPAVAILRPKDRAQAQRRSLSAQYGRGAQPLHTDGAHLRTPPEILVLASTDVSTTPTLLWTRKRFGRLHKGPPDFVRHGMFVVNSGSDSFFAPAWDGAYFRYDPGCMEPCDARARQAALYFKDPAGLTTEHAWGEPGTILVIDNRQALHARASAMDEPDREIQRIAFYTNEAS